MRKLFKETLPSLQLFVKLPDGTMKDQLHYACAHCYCILPNKELAEGCCKQDYCEVCGTEIGKYWPVCTACSKAKKTEKAVTVDLAVYDGSVYDESQDVYYHDYGEFEDSVEPEDRPEFLYCCTTHKLKEKDPEWMAENIMGNLYDDFATAGGGGGLDLVDTSELVAGIKAWLDRQTLEVFHPDYTRKIKVVISGNNT